MAHGQSFQQHKFLDMELLAQRSYTFVIGAEMEKWLTVSIVPILPAKQESSGIPHSGISLTSLTYYQTFGLCQFAEVCFGSWVVVSEHREIWLEIVPHSHLLGQLTDQASATLLKQTNLLPILCTATIYGRNGVWEVTTGRWPKSPSSHPS